MELDDPSTKTVAPEEPLREGPAKAYLGDLLGNIATMLSYASRNGIALPSDLRGQIDALLRCRDVQNCAESFSTIEPRHIRK